jgi:hypothetical protein
MIYQKHIRLNYHVSHWYRAVGQALDHERLVQLGVGHPYPTPSVAR